MLFALTVGTAVYADAFNLVEPRWPEHPHHKRISLEIDLTDSPKDQVDLKDAVIVKNIEWITDIKRATALADDSEDPEEKRLFWHTVWGDNQGVPFTGWGDPDPLNYNPWIATHSPDNPGFHFITDEPPVRHSEQAPEVAPPVIIATMEPPTLKDKKVIQTFNMDDVFPKQIKDPTTQELCDLDSSLPICKDDDVAPPVVIIPGQPVTPTDPIITVPPIISVPVNPVISGTAIPEPSTWLMLFIGFAAIAWKVANVKYLRNSADHKRT